MLLLVDLAFRGLDFDAHYTDSGILSRALYLDLFSDVEISWSVHLLLGSALYTALLFFVAATAAMFLLFGVHARSAAIVSWVLLVSLHNRQPLVLSGSDMILRLLLFWALFLPLARGSNAEWRASSPTHSRIELSPASVALLTQVVLIDCFSLIHKLLDPAWTQLTAIEDSMRVEGVATALGRELDWGHPRRASRNNHWWKYQLTLSQPTKQRLRPAYAGYLIREWNAEHPIERHVESLALVKIDASRSTGQPISKLPRQVLWRGGTRPVRCRG